MPLSRPRRPLELKGLIVHGTILSSNHSHAQRRFAPNGGHLVVSPHKVSNLTKASLLIYDASIGQGCLQLLDAFARDPGSVEIELIELLQIGQVGMAVSEI